MAWKNDLISGFPWNDDDPDDALDRAYASSAAGLLDLVPTEPGSNDEEEYGESKFVLTDAGRAALASR